MTIVAHASGVGVTSDADVLAVSDTLYDAAAARDADATVKRGGFLGAEVIDDL